MIAVRDALIDALMTISWLCLVALWCAQIIWHAGEKTRTWKHGFDAGRASMERQVSRETIDSMRERFRVDHAPRPGQWL